jgi:hypothetical protein
LAAIAVACALALAPTAGAAGPVLATQFSALGPAGVDAFGDGISSGRVQDVEVDPFDRSHLLALADAGLWESTDGGRSWHHLSGLERYGQWSFESGSLAFDPHTRGVVLIASPSDRRTATGRGIYRSTDGGATWSPAGASFQPQCEFEVAGTLGSTTVVQFYGARAFAAGGCGVGVSDDDGATWSWHQVDDGYPNGYSGVAVDTAGNAFTCGSGGVYELAAGRHASWLRVVDFHPALTAGSGWTEGEPIGDGSVDSSTCRITTSPTQAEHVFFSAKWTNDTRTVPLGQSKYFSDVFEAYNDPHTGWHWQDLLGPGHNNGRDVTIATHPDPSGGLDLYWDSDDNDYLLACKQQSGFDCAPGATNDETMPDPPWEPFTEGPSSGLHADTSHFLFGPQATRHGTVDCLLAVAGDGGILRSPSCLGLGVGWSHADAGISALEPYGLALTSIPSLGTDAYLSAQDDGLYALLPDQRGWIQNDGFNDGAGIESTVFATRGELGQVHTYYSSDGNQYLGVRGGFTFTPNTATPFAPPWSGISSVGGPQIADVPTGQQALVVWKPRAPAPSSDQPPPSDHPLIGVFLSSDGTTWSQLLILGGPASPTPGPTIYGAGTRADPVMFVDANGLLDRIRGIASPTVDALLPADVIGPFAAGDAQHLITFACPADGSCANGSVLASNDGGDSWRVLDVVTRLVQNDGFGNDYQLDPGGPVDGQVTSVAVDPSNPAILTLGTRDNGLFESGDGGASWERLAFLAPALNNMRFDVRGRLYFTSYGRGLFFTTPRPDTMTLSPIAAPPPIQRWRVRIRNFDRLGLAGHVVNFSLLSSDGTSTPVGTATTGVDGSARISFVPDVAPGDYKLVAHWTGPGNGELETEAGVKVSKIGK